jgi:single-strand DNA-binding protein
MFMVNGVGNLVADPEIREINGKQLAKFTVATNRNIKRGDAYESVATFLDCESWGSIVQVIERWQKGSKVQFSGELEQQTWERDGQKRSKLVCKVDRVKGLATKDKEKSEEVVVSAGVEDNDVPF